MIPGQAGVNVQLHHVEKHGLPGHLKTSASLRVEKTVKSRPGAK